MLIAEGDENAFEMLFHLYVPKIEPVILNMVHSEAVVKDIIQDIFLSIWISREKLTGIESPSNWIFKIVYNRTYTWLRQQSIHGKAKVKIIVNKTSGVTFLQTHDCICFGSEKVELKVPGRVRV